MNCDGLPILSFPPYPGEKPEALDCPGNKLNKGFYLLKICLIMT